MPTCLWCHGKGALATYTNLNDIESGSLECLCQGTGRVDRETQKDQLDWLTKLVNEESQTN